VFVICKLYKVGEEDTGGEEVIVRASLVAIIVGGVVVDGKRNGILDDDTNHSNSDIGETGDRII